MCPGAAALARKNRDARIRRGNKGREKDRRVYPLPFPLSLSLSPPFSLESNLLLVPRERATLDCSARLPRAVSPRDETKASSAPAFYLLRAKSGYIYPYRRVFSSGRARSAVCLCCRIRARERKSCEIEGAAVSSADFLLLRGDSREYMWPFFFVNILR